MSNSKKGYDKMEEVLGNFNYMEDPEITSLQNDLIASNIDLARVSEQLMHREEELGRAMSALKTFEFNNPLLIKEEIMGAYSSLENRLKENKRMLDRVKASNGYLGIDFFIENNLMVLSGLNLLMSMFRFEKENEVELDPEVTRHQEDENLLG